MKALKTLSVVVAVGIALTAAAAAQTPPAGTQKPATPTPPPGAQKPAEPAAQPKPPVPFPEGAKVGYVSLEYVRGTSEEGKAVEGKIQALFNKRKGELTDRQNKIDEMKKKASAAANVASDEARAQAEREIQKLERELRDATEDAEKELNEFQQRTLGEFLQKVQPVLDAVAKEKGLHMVLQANPAIIAWAHEGLDISDEVAKRLNAGKSAPPAKKN